MRRSKLIVIPAILICGGHSALAADDYLGKWALKPAECKAEPLFTFTSKAVNGLTFGCEAATYAKDGDGWAVAANKCSSEEGKSPDMKFKIAIAGGTLQVAWSDGTKSARLVKCPR